MPIPTFEQWVDWVFTGPEPEFDQLWDNALNRGADWQLDYATTLFRAPSFLLGSYSTQALRDGLWRLPSAGELRDLIWDQRLAWERREACLRGISCFATSSRGIHSRIHVTGGGTCSGISETIRIRGSLRPSCPCSDRFFFCLMRNARELLSMDSVTSPMRVRQVLLPSS